LVPDHNQIPVPHLYATTSTQYGLLGPDATNVTYTADRPGEVERAHGEDGVYLVVGPGTPAFCAHVG
jgi:hypothetical protein